MPLSKRSSEIKKDAIARRAFRNCESDSLTSREREVMKQVAAGLMNKQIAADLGIAEITVKVHRAHMMRKMKARSLMDLIGMADRLGMHRPNR